MVEILAKILIRLIFSFKKTALESVGSPPARLWTLWEPGHVKDEVLHTHCIWGFSLSTHRTADVAAAMIVMRRSQRSTTVVADELNPGRDVWVTKFSAATLAYTITKDR